MEFSTGKDVRQAHLAKTGINMILTKMEIVNTGWFFEDEIELINLSPFYQWGWHIFGTTIMIGWTIFFCLILFSILWKLDLLRLDRDTEIRGIDIKVHGEPAYPENAYGHGWDNDGEYSFHSEWTDFLLINTDNSVMASESNPFNKNTEQVKKLHGAAQSRKDSMTQGGLIQMVLAHHSKGSKEGLYWQFWNKPFRIEKIKIFSWSIWERQWGGRLFWHWKCCFRRRQNLNLFEFYVILFICN